MRKTGRSALPALTFLFALLMVWQLGAMRVDAAYILPTPIQILMRLWELREPLFTVHLPATMAVTGLGLVISVALGLGLAAAMDWSPLLQKCLYPVVVASQTIPTTAIAPLFVLWFGYGIWSKVLVAVLMVMMICAGASEQAVTHHHHGVRRFSVRQNGDGGTAGNLWRHKVGCLSEN